MVELGYVSAGGQGSSVLAVGAGGRFFIYFSRLSSLSLRQATIFVVNANP